MSWEIKRVGMLLNALRSPSRAAFGWRSPPGSGSPRVPYFTLPSLNVSRGRREDLT